VSSAERDEDHGFRPLDHTADRSIEVWGRSLPDLFCAAAEGMFSGSADLALISPRHEWTVEMEADSLPDLLRSWLAELIWLAERDEAHPCAFRVDALEQDPYRLRARAWGGPTPAHVLHTGAPVKAVTYHDLRVWQDGDLWRAHLVFDV
jgi:SHS2 domain-containing protein